MTANPTTEEKQLLDLIKKSSATDLQLLITVKENAKRKLLDDPTQADIAAYERAAQTLERFLKREESDALLFKNRTEVLKYLKKQGYKIGKSKLYNDAAAGWLRVQDDGSILEKDLTRYIKRAGLVKLSAIKKDQPDSLAQLKATHELEKLKEQIAELRFKREVAQGKYIPRDQFEMEIASRLVVLEAGLRHFIQSNLVEWVELAEGKTSQVAALREAMNAGLDEQFNEFADMERFQVIITEDEADAATT